MIVVKCVFIINIKMPKKEKPYFNLAKIYLFIWKTHFEKKIKD